jgi:lambda family phage portal protein
MGDVVALKSKWDAALDKSAYKGSRVLDDWKATSAPSVLKAQSDPAQISHTRKFQAARIDRTTASWFATTNSINQELKTDLNLLRARARDLIKNNEHANKYASLCVSNIIGPNGFSLQSRVVENGVQDKLANEAIERAFYAWAKKGVCDITGRMSFCDFTRAQIRGMPSDGEFLVRKIYGSAARNDFGFALQMIDVDRIDTNYNENESSNRNAVIMGVEVDAYRRPVAYHVFTSHPSEHSNANRKRERIPAKDLFHGYLQEMPEQMRGIPWMSSSMLSLHHLDEFEKSALLAARKGADTLGFFVNPEGTVQVGEADASDAQITISVPGSYDTLPEGYDFKPYTSQYPDAMLGEFCKLYHRRIANGFKVSYASMANDLAEVNFSSIRTGVIEERDQWMVFQNWFIESFLTDVFAEWLKMALLNNQITLPNGSALPAARLDKFMAHQWQGRRWQWVDPLKDIEYARLAVKSGVSSPQIIAAQNGVDIEDVFKDIKKFEDTVKQEGITLINYSDNPNQNPSAEPANNSQGKTS